MKYCDMCGRPLVIEVYIDETYGTVCPDYYEEYENKHLDNDVEMW